MNSYYKLVPNVFLAKCTEEKKQGEIIEIKTRYGKINEVIIYNLYARSKDFWYYSIVRADGFNTQEWAKRKAEKLHKYADNAEIKSNESYKKSNSHSEFLSLGEPIKIGHHSEKRHRKIIEQAQNNMSKCVEFSNKAENYENRAKYWEDKIDTINLSMPESVEYYKYLLEEAIKTHQDLKKNPEKRKHSYSLTYAKKEVNELTKKAELAKKLWG